MILRFFFNDTHARELSALLALRQVGLATGGHIVTWSVDMLMAGLDTPSLRILAGLPPDPNEFELDRYLRDFAEEAGDALPDAATLVEFYPRFIADKIVRGTVDPFDGARRLYDFYLRSGSLRGMGTWSALDDDIALARDGIYGTLPEVEQRIRDAAASLLHQAGGK